MVIRPEFKLTSKNVHTFIPCTVTTDDLNKNIVILFGSCLKKQIMKNIIFYYKYT